MNVTFLRHGPLLPPYNDYSTLSLEELTALAKQIIDPSVDRTKINGLVKSHTYLAKEYDQVFVSQSQRTKDTAVELAKTICLPKPRVIEELNEIVFDPSNLVSKKEYENEKLVLIRKRLFEALVKNTNKESGDTVIKRVQKLDQKLKKTNADSILIITHGFFMRYLDIFYRTNSSTFDLAQLQAATNYSYACGFSVELK